MQELVENPFAKWDRDEPTIPTATLQIYEYIKDSLMRKEKDTNVNRASAASLCPKRRWFQKNGYEGEPLTPRKIINFALGDLTEHMVKYFIKQACVGPGKLYSEVDFGKPVGTFPIQNGYWIDIYEQETSYATIEDIEVSAHADGWGRRNSDGLYELIEVKSAADYGFEDFKVNGPGSYLKQAHVNMMSEKGRELDVVDVRFFYLKKNTANLWDALFKFDKEMWRQIKEDYVTASQDERPETPYRPIFETFRGKQTGKIVLIWICGYCPYTKECYPTAKLEIKNGKPKYYIEGVANEI